MNFMEELEAALRPKDDVEEVKAEDAPVKMTFKKKLVRTKKPKSADDKARAALKGPQPEELT